MILQCTALLNDWHRAADVAGCPAVNEATIFLDAL